LVKKNLSRAFSTCGGPASGWASAAHSTPVCRFIYRRYTGRALARLQISKHFPPQVDPPLAG